MRRRPSLRVSCSVWRDAQTVLDHSDSSVDAANLNPAEVLLPVDATPPAYPFGGLPAGVLGGSHEDTSWVGGGGPDRSLGWLVRALDGDSLAETGRHRYGAFTTAMASLIAQRRCSQGHAARTVPRGDDDSPQSAHEGDGVDGDRLFSFLLEATAHTPLY